MIESLREQLQTLLSSVDSRISREKRHDVQDWIDHSEWSLAVDILADALDVEGVELSSQERQMLRFIIESVDEPLEKYHFLRLDLPD